MVICFEMNLVLSMVIATDLVAPGLLLVSMLLSVEVYPSFPFLVVSQSRDGGFPMAADASSHGASFLPFLHRSPWSMDIASSDG